MKYLLLLIIIGCSSKFNKGDFICHKDKKKETRSVYYKVINVSLSEYTLLQWQDLFYVDILKPEIDRNYILCSELENNDGL